MAVDVEQWRAIVTKICGNEGIHSGCVSVAIVDDAAIHALNRKYLDHDDPTDVLSFVFERSAGYLEGEIVVSAQTARERATEFGLQADSELILYLIHGTLHLVGYGDKDEHERHRMRERERHYLRILLRWATIEPVG
jgi:probable rRNA maturation factor